MKIRVGTGFLLEALIVLLFFVTCGLLFYGCVAEFEKAERLENDCQARALAAVDENVIDDLDLGLGDSGR